MDIGTGIAIASIWFFSTILWANKHISKRAAAISTIAAISMTIYLGK